MATEVDAVDGAGSYVAVELVVWEYKPQDAAEEDRWASAVEAELWSWWWLSSLALKERRLKARLIHSPRLSLLHPSPLLPPPPTSSPSASASASPADRLPGSRRRRRDGPRRRGRAPQGLADKQAAVDAQGNAVRALKAGKAPKPEIDAAIAALNALKIDKAGVEKQLQAAVSGAGDGALTREAFRHAVVNTLERRLFYIPSFKIYRGVAGLYDYGPPGCAVKSNVLAYWRQHFVHEESMLEVDCPCVTPEIVLKASGHVDKFTDLMVKDEKTGTCYRADHLLKDFCNEILQKDLSIGAEKAAELKLVLATLDDLSADELGAKIKEYGIAAPDTKNPLSDPYPFNLMFQTSIGPSGLLLGKYMRPETAQGIFVNFKDLYYYNGNKLPFAAAQIGQAFRNEISPRQGLLRVREFTLAEIEHFVDPEDKSHPKFSQVADLEFLMFPREQQMSGQSAIKTQLGEAVSKGTVNNATLGYFIGRVYLFLTSLGIDKDRLRFRQHLANEMAHYAADCWDAEIECSYGWIECVGIADRSAYDLRAHTEKSGVALVAHEKFSEPREVEKLVISSNKKELGLAFKGNQKMVVESLEAMGEEEALQLKAALESKGEAEFVKPEYESVAQLISRSLTVAGVSHKIDITGNTIGKRYARTDELGVPFAITVDSQVDVTIRERDSKDQVRVSVGEVASVVKEVIDGHQTWSDVWSSFPHHTSTSAEDE
ncbi:hypothetical protein NL676_038106 [Syzygium grande]|nr:hypothetical protein NL676_038106 [Syzygium grande]